MDLAGISDGERGTDSGMNIGLSVTQEIWILCVAWLVFVIKQIRDGRSAGLAPQHYEFRIGNPWDIRLTAHKDENPVFFWLNIIMQLILCILLLLVAIKSGQTPSN